MHTDRAYIGKIPVVIPTTDKRKTIERIVDRLMKIRDKQSRAFYDSYSKLNAKLLDIYSFTPREQKRMTELVNEVMSRKHHG
jgi:hypothetical protein